MRETGTSRGDRESSSELVQVQSLIDPEIHSYIADLKARYSTYAVTLHEGRRIVDQAMGETTLTDVLRQMRQESA